MTTRRWKWSLAAALLVLAVAGAWWIGWSGPEMRLELRFLSYTNESARRFLDYTNEPGSIPGGLPEGAQVWAASLYYALVLATNSGGVPLELYASVDMTNYVTVGGSMQL